MESRSRTFERVKTNSVIKWTARILGIIFLGGLGSGLWDVALKPGLVRTSYGLMSLSSLGIEGVRTAIYERIATGSTSRSGVLASGLITLLTISFFMILFMYFLDRYDEFQRHQNRLDGISDSLVLKSREELAQRFRKRLNLMRRMLYCLGFLIFLLAGTMLVAVSRVSYENEAVAHFQQALKIASPYLTDTDRAIVESKFAQIHSKSEYVAIVDELAKTAKEHGQQVPPFTAW